MVRLVFDLEPFGHLEFARPLQVHAAWTLAEVRPVVRAAAVAAAAGRWAAGFVAYEAAPAFDPALRVRPPESGPLAWFGIFDRPRGSKARSSGEARLRDLAPEISRRQYGAALRAVRRALGNGAAYQVNLTFRLRGSFAGDPLALYQHLRAAQGGGYGALLQLGDRAFVSASPELFFQQCRGRLTSRPMKGTARRGRFGEEDDRIAAALAASEKDRAENVMIVDLMRNDIGRVARAGTVRVAELCTVERYRTVWQMTSTVVGRLRPRVGLEAVLGALFPCGSVTGAPKASAMGLIADLERSPRGPYCGAVGLVAPGGEACFNVAIRTVDLDLRRGWATYGTGGGITWLSSSQGEWDEALDKAAVLSEPVPTFQLVETLRLEGGGCRRLSRHLARLEASARYFGFVFDADRIRRAVDQHVRESSGDGRLRLLLAQDGEVAVEISPAPPPATEPLAVALACAPVSSQDRWLFHKTTRREVYQARRRERPEVFDVLLQNERGELTELTIGNLVVEIGGERLTPPREAGLLAGVFRGELLARGEILERTLRPRDLARARRLWLVNSLRGWVPVRLVDGLAVDHLHPLVR